MLQPGLFVWAIFWKFQMKLDFQSMSSSRVFFTKIEDHNYVFQT